MTATLNPNQCSTQPGTSGGQPGTQLDTQPLTEDDMAHADTALILRVLDRNGLDQTWLAAECNLSKSYVSRVLSGQHPVPHDMVRRLFHRTSDADLLELFSGSGAGGPMRLNAVRRESVPVGVDIEHALPTVMAHLAEAVQQSRGGQPIAVIDGIHNAMNVLLGALDTACERHAAGTERPNIELVGRVIQQPGTATDPRPARKCIDLRA